VGLASPIAKSARPGSARSQLAPEFALARGLEGGERDEEHRRRAEGEQGGHPHSQGAERQGQAGRDEPRDADAPRIAQPEGVVPEQVERDAAQVCASGVWDLMAPQSPDENRWAT